MLFLGEFHEQHQKQKQSTGLSSAVAPLSMTVESEWLLLSVVWMGERHGPRTPRDVGAYANVSGNGYQKSSVESARPAYRGWKADGLISRFIAGRTKPPLALLRSP
jgi:hypothetical protein